MMKTLGRIITIIGTLCATGPLYAQETRNDEYWLKALADQNLKHISDEMLSSSHSHPWPRLTWSGDGPSQNSQNRALASRLFEALRRQSLTPVPAVSQDLRGDLNAYRVIVNTLRKSGGYFNFVLMDTAYRLAAWEAGKFIVSHPESARSILGELTSLGSSVWTTPEVKALIIEQEPKARVASIPDTEDIRYTQEILNLLHSGLESTLTSGSDKSTSTLIASLSVPNLFTRLLETRKLMTFSIPGTVEFLDRGGRAADLMSPEDISSFTSRIGHDRVWFRFPLLAVKMLGPEDVLFVLRSCESRDTPVFIKIAVN